MRLWALLILVALLCIATVPGIAQPTLKIVAYDGSQLRGAQIRVSTLDGRVFEFTLDPSNPFVVRDVVKGVLFVEVVSWKSVPIGYRQNVTIYSDQTLVVPSIGKLTLKVSGSRGQALEGASVKITYSGQTIEEGSTDTGGVYTTLLPAASYGIVVEYGGRRVEKTIAVEPSRENVVNVQLDVFMSLGGMDLSLTEFLGLALLVIVIVIALIVVTVEYSNWRAKRARRVLATPE
jgi:hypothetical protein